MDISQFKSFERTAEFDLEKLKNRIRKQNLIKTEENLSNKDRLYQNKKVK